MSADRATVRIVEGGEPENPVVSVPAQDPDSLSPNAMAPPPPPTPEQEPQVGGPAIPTPTVEEKAAASGGSLAERLQARFHAIAATEEFAVPGWELSDGRPGLIIIARAFGDRKSYNEGLSNEAFIARSTHQLLFVQEDGSREEIPRGWGPQLAEMIGKPGITRAADLVALVISKPDPSNPDVRIPNVAGIGALATEIIQWSRRGQRNVEDELGE